MVLLYPQLFNPFSLLSKPDEKAESVENPKLPLDDKVPAQTHATEAAETVRYVKQTYHLERRTFL